MTQMRVSSPLAGALPFAAGGTAAIVGGAATWRLASQAPPSLRIPAALGAAVLIGGLAALGVASLVGSGGSPAPTPAPASNSNGYVDRTLVPVATDGAMDIAEYARRLMWMHDASTTGDGLDAADAQAEGGSAAGFTRWLVGEAGGSDGRADVLDVQRWLDTAVDIDGDGDIVDAESIGMIDRWRRSGS
jgi:hypothetical protein